jgi:inosose dehydratase
MKRRSFITQTALAAAGTVIATEAKKTHIATNTYPWGTFAKRAGKVFPLHTDESLAAIASTGITGYEPIIKDASEFDGLATRLRAHGLEMRSLYVNSILHDEDQARASIAAVLAVARRAAEAGVKIIVTNPSPIRWGGTEDKTDAQLLTQAASLGRLGAEVQKLGLTLAYHNHDSELRQGAREFHHMLMATDATVVKFCLDSHWIFRGCGDSQVALFDAVERYGTRIVELHLRQSAGGKWTETFSASGDVDYQRLATWLKAHELKPNIVLEQAVEDGSPVTLDAVEAHKQSLRGALEAFAEFV